MRMSLDIFDLSVAVRLKIASKGVGVNRSLRFFDY